MRRLLFYISDVFREMGIRHPPCLLTAKLAYPDGLLENRVSGLRHETGNQIGPEIGPGMKILSGPKFLRIQKNVSRN